MKTKHLISVVIPVFNEEDNVRPLYDELLKIAGDDFDWEFIFVDDGSRDESWPRLQALHEQDKRVVGIRFVRNFGHQYALLAGMDLAVGQAVITMDGDLQHPPAVISRLVEEWMKGSKVVQTVRRDTGLESWVKRTTSAVFYRIFSLLGGVKLDPGMADFRLLDRQVVDELLRLRESNLFLRGMVEWLGYPKALVEFECRARGSGHTKYSFLRMMRFAWDGISSFSVVPLRLTVLVGLLTSLASFYWFVEAKWIQYTQGAKMSEWASTVGMVALLFGILFIFLGILAEYVVRILIQVRGRPRYVIANTLGRLKSVPPAVDSDHPRAPQDR